MRRLIVEEPVSRAAVWGRRIAWFSLPVLLSGLVFVRGGGINLTPGFAVMGAAVLLACMALILAIAALIQIWRKGRRGLGFAISALLISGLVLAYPGMLGVRALIMPYYADLSTDAVHPPSFSRSRNALIARDGIVPQVSNENILTGLTAGAVWEYAPGVQKVLQGLPIPVTDRITLRQMQRRIHPDLVSLSTELTPEVAFARARTAAEKEGWIIVDAIPPGGRFGIGHLDAMKFTQILKIPVDVTVRLKPGAEGTIIDVRTIPRYRLFDVGIGPRHIEQYLEHFSPESGAGK